MDFAPKESAALLFGVEVNPLGVFLLLILLMMMVMAPVRYRHILGPSLVLVSALQLAVVWRVRLYELLSLAGGDSCRALGR